VIENKDGSNVHVVSPPMNELRSPRSLPAMAMASDLSSFPPCKLSSNHSLPITPVDGNDPDNDHQYNGRAGFEKAPTDSKEDCDDEWEEDDGTPELNETGSPSNFYDGPVDRNRSTASHRLYPSRHSRRSRRKGSSRGPGSPSVNARQSIDSVRRTAGGSRMVEFVDVEKQGLRKDQSRTRRSSRSPSPSRSIRFAEYPDRPSKKSSHFHHRSNSTKAFHKNSAAKNKSRLKNFVAPAVDSWRRSSMASGNATPPNVESSQRSSYFVGGAHEEPPPPSSSSRASVIQTDHNIDEASEEEDVQK
jgi:hypothetical protein